MLRSLRALFAIGGISLPLVVASAAEPQTGGVEFFERKIRPVLVEHCYQCHSSDAQQASKLKGGLLLDSGAGLQAGGDSGALISIDKPADSLLIKALRHQDLEMPPAEKLPDEVIANFEAWISQGAPVPPETPTTNRLKTIDWEQARASWAFQTPVPHAPPAVGDAAWPEQLLDFFILAELERRGLKPVAPASRSDWIRRATFDLIGLPPTPEEVAAFELDDSTDARRKVLDRLLSSPHYGERWGRYWLDLARYADDQGNSFLSPTPQAYLYRDWVVRAFNRDLPYDEFLRLQIAGDLLTEPATDYVDRLAGLGFQGLGPQFRKGAAGEAKAKADELEDRIDTFARGVLGLTVSCARCHDHKFDPIPTRDYYSLAAAYNGAVWSDRMMASPEVVAAHQRWEQDVKTQQAGLENWLLEQGRLVGRLELEKTTAYVVAASKVRALKRHEQKVDLAVLAQQDALQPYVLNRWIALLDNAKTKPALATLLAAAEAFEASAVVHDGTVDPSDELRAQASAFQAQLVAALAAVELSEKPATDPVAASPAASAEQKDLVRELCREQASSPYFVAAKDAPAVLGENGRSEYEQRKASVETLAKSPPPAGPIAPSVSGGGEAMRVFVRGNPLKLGDPAPPGFLRVLRATSESSDEAAAGAEPPAPFTRLDLAQAIASPQNPLTARVFVNRVWHYHFGRGIVATLGNFGKLGAPPTHPELLDTLTAGFIQSGWSVKWLHREIMLSATYRLGSATTTDNLAKDPDNHYRWRMTPRRLDVEGWRDAVLSVAARLDPQVGGPSLNLAEPAVREIPNFPTFSRLNGLDIDNPANGRRSIYCIVSRYAPNPTLVLFDFPEPNVTSDLRNTTTIPQQQLFVLNSQFMIEMGRAFAHRLEQSATTDADRLNLAWHLAYGRSPTESEATIGSQFLQSTEATDAADKLSRWEQLCHALLASNEFTFVP